MSYVDLHLHSNHSDGSDPPRRVVERAVEQGLAAIALTDHDTVSGLAEAADAADELGIEFLNGTEISTAFRDRELHVLGLGIRPENERLKHRLEELAAGRFARARTMVQRLHELGIPVDYDRLAARSPDGVIGRMHVAREIVELGFAKTIQDAFDKYIKAGRPAYIKKKAMDVAEALELIHGAGGLGFVAHPGVGKLRKLLNTLLELPFDGIEVYHSRHTADDIAYYGRIAEERGLLVSGGSDCHGDSKEEGCLMGKARVPYEVFARIKARLEASDSAVTS